MTDSRDDDDRLTRRLPGGSAGLGERSVVGGAPIGGGSSMASSGAFDTIGGGDLGGDETRAPGARDPGDSAGDLRPESADTEGGSDVSDLDRAEAERLAAQVFGDAGTDGAASRGLGGLGGDDRGSGVAGLGGLQPDSNQAGAGGLDSRNLGGGGVGMGQTEGVARQSQTFGLGGEQQQDPAVGGLNEQQDERRAQAAAQGRTDASDAQGLLDKTRAQPGIPGADPNNDNL